MAIPQMQSHSADGTQGNVKAAASQSLHSHAKKSVWVRQHKPEPSSKSWILCVQVGSKALVCSRPLYQSCISHLEESLMCPQA